MHYTMLRFFSTSPSTWLPAIPPASPLSKETRFSARSTKSIKVSPCSKIRSWIVRIVRQLLKSALKFRERKTICRSFLISWIPTAQKCPMIFHHRLPQDWSILARACTKIICRQRTGNLGILLKNSIDYRYLLIVLNIILRVAPLVPLTSINRPWSALIARGMRITAWGSRFANVLMDLFTMHQKTIALEIVKKVKFITEIQENAIEKTKPRSLGPIILMEYVLRASLLGIRWTKFVSHALNPFRTGVKNLQLALFARKAHSGILSKRNALKTA